MSDREVALEHELRKERLKGRNKIYVALVAGLLSILGTVVTTMLGWYLPLQSDYTNSQNEISELNNRISQLEEMISTLQSKSEGGNLDLQDQISSLIEERNQLEQENSKLREELSNPNSDYHINDRKSMENVVYLTEVCAPYEHSLYETPATIKMMGKSYENGFTMPLAGYAIFNLDGAYTTLDFDFGHVDGASMLSGNYIIYLDGKYSQTIEASPEMIVTHTIIELNKARQMKIVGEHDYPTGSAYIVYGFANAVLK